MTLSAITVTMLVTYGIPAVTALLTKANASTWLKQFITALLAAVNGLVTTAVMIDGEAVISKEALILALGSFGLAQATYWGLYKPHDANNNIAPTVGLGGSAPDAGADRPANAGVEP